MCRLICSWIVSPLYDLKMKIKLKRIIKILTKKKYKISIVESCTGGMLSNAFTSISGSSKIFNFGLVTYSNLSKNLLLKVPKEIIKKKGAVSPECCLAMVKSLSKLSKSDIALSITGIAGPKGSTINKPVGLVYIGIKTKNIEKVYKFRFKNRGRHYVKRSSVNKSLDLILSIFK